ncbi:MAG: hypothetical protein ACRDZO_03690 [Egibacteraceae bacterium]
MSPLGFAGLPLAANASKPHRVQGCYVSETEIEQIVARCKGQRETSYEPGVIKDGADAAALTRAAMDLVVR